jgi:hypothetical protein
MFIDASTFNLQFDDNSETYQIYFKIQETDTEELLNSEYSFKISLFKTYDYNFGLGLDQDLELELS